MCVNTCLSFRHYDIYKLIDGNILFASRFCKVLFVRAFRCVKYDTAPTSYNVILQKYVYENKFHSIGEALVVVL